MTNVHKGDLIMAKALPVRYISELIIVAGCIIYWENQQNLRFANSIFHQCNSCDVRASPASVITIIEVLQMRRDGVVTI
jgi:hypothetical protein